MTRERGKLLSSIRVRKLKLEVVRLRREAKRSSSVLLLLLLLMWPQLNGGARQCMNRRMR